LQEQYNKKKHDWRIKDQIEDKMRKKELENKHSRKEFMKEIETVPRIAQIFVDNYSLRDDETNKNIVEINRILRKQHLDKTTVNKKIDDFLVQLEERKVNNLMELNKMTEVFTIEENNVKEVMKKNLENEKFTEENENLLNSNKPLNKVGVDMTNQTVTDNFNIFKQYRDKILDKNQEEIHKIKPMTAGEFLNEKGKGVKNTLGKEKKFDYSANDNIGVMGLSKLLKERPEDIKKILESQLPKKETLNRMHNISKTIKKENPLIVFDAKKESYFGKSNMSKSNRDFHKHQNFDPFKNKNEDIFSQQVEELIHTESRESSEQV